MKMNLKAILASWSPWHLRKRIAMLEESLEKLTECKHEFVDSCHEFIVKQNLQRGEEIVRLIKENERLKDERRWFIYVFELYKFIEQDETKGDTHEQK